MNRVTSMAAAMDAIWQRSGYDRGFISNPFAGDEAARLGLVRTARVLDQLGNPERDVPIVHVAGSKGKGSTSSFIDSILRAAGRRTGRFLSPHLHSYRERFVVQDTEIGEAAFVPLVDEVLEAIAVVEQADAGSGQVTAWELSTAMALLWFVRSGCEVAVVEVGLGGTLDATNVVDPVLSVITTLDYEHTAILGATMAEIAANKAGIIKPGRPVVSADQPSEGRRVIEDRARQLEARLQMANRDWIVTGTDRGFSVTGPDWQHQHLMSSLAGQHQVDNAGLAIAAIHALADAGLMPNGAVDAAVRTGIGTTFIPGRFEIIHLDANTSLVLDGAHSPASAVALAEAVRAQFPTSKVTMIVGILSDKDPGALLEPFRTIADRWLVAPPGSPRALGADVLARSITSMGARAEIASNVAAAIDMAVSVEPPIPGPRVVVITGSFQTVAEARVVLGLA